MGRVYSAAGRCAPEPAAKEEARKLKELEKMKIAEERELKRLELAREKERKAEERRKAVEERKKWVPGGGRGGVG